MENDNEKHSRRDFLRELLQGSFVAGAGLFLGSKLNIAQAMGIGGGVCSSSYECAGGGGNCGSSYSCAGQGSRGQGKCSSSYECGGGGGKCGSSYTCAGT